MSVFKVTGHGGELEVFEDKLTITPKGLLGFINKGLKGTKTIPFGSISGVQHRKASMMVNGYLQFTIPGGNESKGGVLAAGSDENSFMFAKSENEVIEKIKDYIERRVQEMRNPRPAAAAKGNISDELAKLADLKKQGVLSEEEFTRAKQRLLS